MFLVFSFGLTWAHSDGILLFFVDLECKQVSSMLKLIVEELNARDLLPTDHHGSASPFVEVDFNGHRQHTQTKIRDLYPTWNEKLIFDIQKPRNLNNCNIQVILYDDRQKEFLGCVQISGASVSLLESEATVRQYALCKRGSFSHSRGVISLKIYTLRAQYCNGNQGPHRRLNIKKAPKLVENSDHDEKKCKRGDKRWDEEDETRNLHSEGTRDGAIVHQNLTNTSSSVYITPTMYYLRVEVIEAQHLAPFDKNRQPEFFVRLKLGTSTQATRTSKVHDGNPVWKEDLMLVASEEMSDDFLIVDACDRLAHFRDELIGRTVVPMSGIPQRFDSTVQLEARWFSLYGVSSNEEGNNEQEKILLRLCLEAGYHVFDGSRGGFQPSAKHMKKDRIGTLELQVLSARGLPPMKKQKDGGMNSTDAYCVAKYGNKWVRTRTIVNSQEPCWNEHYVWEVYDPCTVITIGVFDNCNVYESKQDFKDMRIGKVLIPVQTLEANHIHTQYYPLLVLYPSGLKNHGELQVAVRFTCVAWANTIAQYTKPVLPKMNYLLPLNVRQLDWVRHQALQVLAASLARAEPPFKREIVEYMLGHEYYLWSLRRQKANFERLMSFVLGIIAMYRWFDEICHWRNPMETIFIHFLYLVFIWYPKLMLPAFFLSLSMKGLWNYRFRARNPPHLDARLSQAEPLDLDHLDEEVDTFPTSQRYEIVKMRYDRLRSIAGRYQKMVGDIATLGEKAMAILTCTDIRVALIFTAIVFFWVVFIYMASFRVVVTLLGLYWLCHPWLRTKTPSLLVNLFTRLPSKMDMIMLI